MPLVAHPILRYNSPSSAPLLRFDPSRRNRFMDSLVSPRNARWPLGILILLWGVLLFAGRPVSPASETPAPFSLEIIPVVSSETLPRFFDEDLLREFILQEIPQLADALELDDTLAAARLLFEWAAASGDFSLNGRDLAQDALSVADLYFYTFRNDLAGMSCGGYGDYYSGVLSLFGIDSLNIGFGELPELTHVTVVIPLRVEGSWKFYLLDPTFGLSFTLRETGRLADYFDLIDDHAEGCFERWTPQQISLAAREFLSSDPLDSPDFDFVRKSDRYYVYHSPAYGFQSYLKTMKSELVRHGYDLNHSAFVQLQQTRLFNVLPYGPSALEASQSFIEEAVARNIPFGFPSLPHE